LESLIKRNNKINDESWDNVETIQDVDEDDDEFSDIDEYEDLEDVSNLIQWKFIIFNNNGHIYCIFFFF